MAQVPEDGPLVEFECDLTPPNGMAPGHPGPAWPRIRFNFDNGWSASIVVRVDENGCDATIASLAACPTGRWGEGVTEIGESEAFADETARFLAEVASRPPCVILPVFACHREKPADRGRRAASLHCPHLRQREAGRGNGAMKLFDIATSAKFFRLDYCFSNGWTAIVEHPKPFHTGRGARLTAFLTAEPDDEKWTFPGEDEATADQVANWLHYIAGLPGERIIPSNGIVYRITPDWRSVDIRPATLAEIQRQSPGATFRVDVASGLVQGRPPGADEFGWIDIREATPEEISQAKAVKKD